MVMPNIYDWAKQILDQHPEVANTPMAQNFRQFLDNRDDAKGIEMANNILESNGMTKDSALNDIKNRSIPNLPFF